MTAARRATARARSQTANAAEKARQRDAAVLAEHRAVARVVARQQDAPCDTLPDALDVGDVIRSADIDECDMRIMFVTPGRTRDDVRFEVEYVKWTDNPTALSEWGPHPRWPGRRTRAFDTRHRVRVLEWGDRP